MVTFPMPGWKGNIGAHHGVAEAVGGSDLMVPQSGTQPVVSMVPGKVTFVSTEATAPNSGGNAVQILGDDGRMYYYAHLSEVPNVKNGDRVNEGQQLGLAGNSGNAKKTPPHLHIGIGPNIQTGVGPQGGIGAGFDAITLLKNAYNNQGTVSQNVNVPQPSQPQNTQLISNSPYAQKAIAAAQKYGVDPLVFQKQIQQESGWNPSALSPAGAAGIAQIVPKFHPGVNPYNPDEALDYAAKLMRSNLDKYGGDYSKALAAYNAGGGAVDKYGGIPPYEETQRYVKNILSGVQPQNVSAPQPSTVYQSPSMQQQMPSMVSGLFGNVQNLMQSPMNRPVSLFGTPMYSSMMPSAISKRPIIEVPTIKPNQMRDITLLGSSFR